MSYILLKIRERVEREESRGGERPREEKWEGGKGNRPRQEHTCIDSCWPKIEKY